MSKNCLNALTREQQKYIDLNCSSKNIIISAVHPGEVIYCILNNVLKIY
jgi:hypothetical protein